VIVANQVTLRRDPLWAAEPEEAVVLAVEQLVATERRYQARAFAVCRGESLMQNYLVLSAVRPDSGGVGRGLSGLVATQANYPKDLDDG
jgi:hypothetical protein